MVGLDRDARSELVNHGFQTEEAVLLRGDAVERLVAMGTVRAGAVPTWSMALVKAMAAWTHGVKWRDELTKVVLMGVGRTHCHILQHSAVMRSPTLVPRLSLPCTRHEGRLQVDARYV
jgi:hypothetical protein